MKAIIKIFFFLAYFFALFSCKKSTDINSTEKCPYENDPTILTITNRSAIILSTGPAYQIKLNASDTLLNPCILSDNYKIDSLKINITGGLKPTQHNAYDPCKCYNFVVSKISL